MTPDDLYQFLLDPKLTEMVETNKTTDDVFDVFNLYENQHSELLAWCMNPNEGHGQGDAVIKDFLVAAYHAHDGATWDNKKFFKDWTPGRIRTSSFGAAFVAREFHLSLGDGIKNGRLDLFLVDPQNKLLVTIENKAGATLSATQLDDYVDAVKKNIASRPAFAGYQQAYIVLDRDLNDYSEDHLSTLSKRWTLLDYTWMATSAERARFQVERKNGAAQLLVAYCQRQTDWESDAEKRSSDLAVELATAHPEVLETIGKLKKRSIKDWTPLSGHEGELTIFIEQHRSVCEKLVETRGVAVLRKQLLKALPDYAEFVDSGRTWLAAIPPECQPLQPDEEESWPLYAFLFRVAKSSKSSTPQYNLQLVWNRDQFDSALHDESALRAHFAQAFPALSAFKSSGTRKVQVAENMTHAAALAEMKKLLEKIAACMKTLP